MWHSMWGWDGGGWGWFGLMHLLWWVLVIAVVAMGVRWAIGPGSRGRDSRDRPLEILRERYARGEIDKGEYDERLRHLKG